MPSLVVIGRLLSRFYTREESSVARSSRLKTVTARKMKTKMLMSHDVTQWNLLPGLSDSQSSLVMPEQIQLNYHRNCASFVYSCSMMTC